MTKLHIIYTHTCTYTDIYMCLGEGPHHIRVCELLDLGLPHANVVVAIVFPLIAVRRVHTIGEGLVGFYSGVCIVWWLPCVWVHAHLHVSPDELHLLACSAANLENIASDMILRVGVHRGLPLEHLFVLRGRVVHSEQHQEVAVVPLKINCSEEEG